MRIAQWKMNSAIGPLYLAASSKGLCGVFIKKQAKIPALKSLTGTDPKIKNLEQAVRELSEYFKGKRKKFNLKFDAEGTPFQKSVWAELNKIPYGTTCSYRDIAKKIKNEKAVRAVGSANGKNPLCVVVPCHRVIAADGTLGGYSGGLKVKKKLLALEKRNAKPRTLTFR